MVAYMLQAINQRNPLNAIDVTRVGPSLMRSAHAQYRNTSFPWEFYQKTYCSCIAHVWTADRYTYIIIIFKRFSYLAWGNIFYSNKTRPPKL